MVFAEPRTDKASGGTTESAPGRRVFGWPLRRLVVIAIAVPALLLAGGFLLFAWNVPASEIRLQERADGIVVLTGGASRVVDALELLATKRGQRLLITGVHRATGPVEIARTAPEFRNLFGCCVDLDRSAVNTVGNATETRRWAKTLGFHSLIVVTSNYHMPRAMAEIGHQLPDVTLIPYPVVPENWSANATSARLLVSEYLKYMIAVARMRIGQVPAASKLS